MEIRIVKPNDIEEEYLSQIVNLIIRGGQIKGDCHSIRILIAQAELVGFILLEEIVICTATLKNPYREYKEKVFNLADLNSSKNYNKELGYLVTHPDFENQGHCQKLLLTIFYQIRSFPIYATTRKASIVHILSKFGFRQKGSLYNNDLMLLIYDPPVDTFQNEMYSTKVLIVNPNFQLSLSQTISNEIRLI